jgi:alpha-methylacyl-CoA racemase
MLPLVGFKVVEFAGIGPGPFCAMLLQQMGADVLRIERKDNLRRSAGRFDFLDTGRTVIRLDLKDLDDRKRALKLVGQADALIEGFRPGVMERLGLGPEVCLEANQRLVYGRITGWGQTGPLANKAGHDINYLALSGALHAIGPTDEKPSIPLNLIADFGGGAMYLLAGLLSALLAATRSGRGQVIDVAMIDGTLSLMTLIFGFHASGRWLNKRSSNRLDGGHPCYSVYETADHKYLAVGALEERFYAEFLQTLELDAAEILDRNSPSNWPALKELFSRIIREKTRTQWEDLFRDADACVTPVMEISEVPSHPHIFARESFASINEPFCPSPAPRFAAAGTAHHQPADLRNVWNLAEDDISRCIPAAGF